MFRAGYLEQVRGFVVSGWSTSDAAPDRIEQSHGCKGHGLLQRCDLRCCLSMGLMKRREREAVGTHLLDAL